MKRLPVPAACVAVVLSAVPITALAAPVQLQLQGRYDLLVGFSDVSDFTRAMVRQILQDAVANDWPSWNSEMIGVSSLRGTEPASWAWADQDTGVGTIVSVETVPEPPSLLLGTGQAALGRTWRQGRQ